MQFYLLLYFRIQLFAYQIYYLICVWYNTQNKLHFENEIIKYS
jgi:hypothetical protein